MNNELLEKAAAMDCYPHIGAIKKFEETKTWTEDTYDSGFLEPWAQWVSIHTGVSCQVHGIKHLGDVPNLKGPQIWETLGKVGITSGVWGVMNGSRRDEKNCLFFLPDPWTAREQAYPQAADQFSVLARYVSRNYLNLSAGPFISAAFQYGSGLLKILSPGELMEAANILIEGIWRFGATKMVLGAFFEFTSACAFLKFKNQYHPQFSILFLNLIAHTQHNYWVDQDELSAELLYSLKVVDMVLRKVLRIMVPSEVLLVANGLSQINTKEEDPWILYRQKDQRQFLKAIGIKVKEVEPLMTHDALLYFANGDDCRLAFELLVGAIIKDEKLFYVERDPADTTKLFYRLNFTKKTRPDSVFKISEIHYKFFDHFQEIVTRTGKHSQEGFVIQTKAMLPARMQNHEMAKYILKFFEIEG